MHLLDVYPLNQVTITKASGSYVWNNEGQAYLDMYGGHAVISIGHSHPHWVLRIQTQLQQIAFYSNSVILPIQEQLAEKLATVSGKNDYKLFLINSGAEANENAMKLASFYNGRKKIVAFTKSFHGRTSLAVAATDNPAIVAPVNATDNITFLPFNDIAALEAYFAAEGNNIAAVIVEGIQGVGGIIEATVPFLTAIRQLCTQYNAVYIADSVQCGYGRTGQFFAHDIAGVNADIYTMAKGMGNGFPIGGILVAPHLPQKHGMLGTTFGGNPLACAAALAVLEVIESEQLMSNAAQQGNTILTALRQMPELHSIRGRGLMIGFEMQPPHEQLKKKLLVEQHVFTGEAKPNVIRLLPSLAIDDATVQTFLERLQTALR
ncbi:MAG TPA: aspartate aminotransferase family protein [Chitinophagaceae bacterium]|nr:aspartate aminotransferase family protein [Chitinophagaceae bacterium]